MRPVVATVGTEVTILVAVGVPVIVAVVPLNFTMLFAAVVLKLVPVMVTEAPTAPLVGLKEVMVGVVAVVTVKLVVLVAVTPPTVTVMAPVAAPVGTVVFILIAVGVPVIVAAIPLKNLTVLLVAVVLKFVPVMVTAVPTLPFAGVKLVMVGVVVDGIVLRNRETVGLFTLFNTAKSGFPSPSRSSITTLEGLCAVAKSTLELKLMVPGTLPFLKSETALIPLLTTAKSGFPSPSKSPMVTL